MHLSSLVYSALANWDDLYMLCVEHYICETSKETCITKCNCVPCKWLDNTMKRNWNYIKKCTKIHQDEILCTLVKRRNGKGKLGTKDINRNISATNMIFIYQPTRVWQLETTAHSCKIMHRFILKQLLATVTWSASCHVHWLTIHIVGSEPKVQLLAPWTVKLLLRNST